MFIFNIKVNSYKFLYISWSKVPLHVGPVCWANLRYGSPQLSTGLSYLYEHFMVVLLPIYFLSSIYFLCSSYPVLIVKFSIKNDKLDRVNIIVTLVIQNIDYPVQLS